MKIIGSIGAQTFPCLPSALIQAASSAIRAAGCDGHTLTVGFCAGRIFNHPGVPCQVHREFMNARSMGEHCNRHIRGRYR